MTDIRPIVKSKCLKLKWVSFLYIHYVVILLQSVMLMAARLMGICFFWQLAIVVDYCLKFLFCFLPWWIKFSISLCFSDSSAPHCTAAYYDNIFHANMGIRHALWPRNLEVKSWASINSFILFFWSKTNELFIESAFKSTYGYFLTVRRGVRSSLQTTSSSMQTAGFHRR